MRMPHRLYYSRRITEMDGAVKVSGLWPGWSFNFMDVQSEFVHDGHFRGNAAVVRLTQDLGERSHLGYYARMRRIWMPGTPTTAAWTATCS